MTMNLQNELNALKKASLHFNLVQTEKDITPKLDTYFGGKPFITNTQEIHDCPICKKNMQFIFQLIMPIKNSSTKKLYAFYYCFECVQDNYEGAYAVNIYSNPTEDKMVKELDYISRVPYCDVEFLPAYDIPEWHYCKDSSPEFINKLETMYGTKAYETYEQMEKRVQEYAVDTGNKIKGYPSYMEYSDIPRCPHTQQPMEPLVQMESIPELNLSWLGKDSYLILFKSPLYDEFELRTVNFSDYEEEIMGDDEAILDY